MDNVPPHTICMHAYIRVCLCVCACVCVASKANRAWGHPKRLRRRIQLCTHMYVCEFAWIRLHTHTLACVYVSIIAQQLNYQNQINVYMCQCKCSLCLCLHIYIHTHTYSCACVCVRISFTLYALCLLFCLLRSIWNVQRKKKRSTRHIFIWPVKCVKRKHIYLYN